MCHVISQGPSMKNEELKDLVTAGKHSRGIWKEQISR